MAWDVIVKKELRPCVVEIPEKVERRRTIKSIGKEFPEYHNIVVRQPEFHNALFHRLHESFYTIGQPVAVGGRAAGQMSEMLAIVEYEDGTVHMVNPEWIRFVDRKTEEYCFDVVK